jgi:hypothetical protein
MMIAEHGPDTCPASNASLREKFMPHMGRRDEVAKKLGAGIQGSWSDMPGHLLYFVVDAPNAHTVTQLAMELHLMDWNTITVRPVVNMEEATQKVEGRQI